jgi:hypothetical protein
MPRRGILILLLVLNCTLARASESLVLLDDFLDPALRGARMCLPPKTHAKDSEPTESAPSDALTADSGTVTADSAMRLGCEPSAGPTLTSVDVSAGVVRNLVENLEFLKQGAGYANLGLHRYFELGSSAKPFDLALNASAFDTLNDTPERRVRDNIQLRAGYYSLYSSEDPLEVVTTRQSLSLESTSFAHQSTEYLASFDTQLQELGGSGHLMFEYRWGGNEPHDFRVRSYTIVTDLLHLSGMVPDSLRGARGRLQLAVGFGGGVSGGQLHFVPFSINLHAEYDIFGRWTLYAGTEYAYQPSAHGFVSGNNVQLQIGVYTIPFRVFH